MSARHLSDYLEASASRFPERVAVVDSSGGRLTYAELNRQAEALAAFLVSRGLASGDRVGILLPKSLAAVVSIFGVLKAGCSYVPVDSSAPLRRSQAILGDCQVRALILDGHLLDVLPDLCRDSALASIIVVGSFVTPPDASLQPVPFGEILMGPAGPVSVSKRTTDLAYILYTSGSTGVPKGVMLTHENALTFVEWCSSLFDPTEADRFSSHAPFHFDLSILDIFLPIKHGASVYLISQDLGRNPRDLARFVSANRLTVWYSTPSILSMLVQYAGTELDDSSSPRLVLFAGEVFPVGQLRQLRTRWPSPVYYNLYGPTETNVCTFARIPKHIPDDRDTPYPIGFPCSHCRAIVLDGENREVVEGEEGLLYISGPSVFEGYWGRPVENAAAFVERNGVHWYNTGDVVRWNAEDGFAYVGRKDRMVKRRGYRIELGEIERALYMHPRVREAATVSTSEASGVSIVAFVGCPPHGAPSIIELKMFCAANLPAHMIPDRFIVCATLPKTSTDKIDYQSLRRQLLGPDEVVLASRSPGNRAS